MELKTKIFLRKRFKEYFWKNPVTPPKDVERREFGVGTLEDKIKFRHRAFKTGRELQDYLKRDAPFYVSYSSAYYEFPSNQPMSSKNWLGADLVFDLDVGMEFLDDERLEHVKGETHNLIQFLTDDFGFSGSDIGVNFSGGKGYHVRIMNKEVRGLDNEQRREIVDYITGTGLDLACFMREERGEGVVLDAESRRRGAPEITGPTNRDRGWAGRIYRVAYDVVVRKDKRELMKISGIGEKTAENLVRDRQRNVKSLGRGRWDGLLHFSSGLQQRVIEESAVGLTGDTDRMVTIDTSRLMRLPDSIHGGTGLKAIKVKNLDDFNPLTDAVVFGADSVGIRANGNIPKFDLMGRKIGPYKSGQETEVPEYAAVYLFLKGSADLAG